MATFSQTDVYRVKNVEAGTFMTMTHAAGRTVITCTPASPGDKAAQWRLVPAAGGKYTLKNEDTGLEAIPGKSDVALTGGQAGIPWLIQASAGQYIIHSGRNNIIVAMDKASNRTIVEADQSQKRQRWVIEKDTTTGGGTGEGESGGESGTKPPPPPVTGHVKPGRYVIRNVKTGTVVDLEKCIPALNTKIFGYQANGGGNQQWDVQPSETAPYVTLRCVFPTNYAAHSALTDGASLASTDQAQEIVLIPADKGWYIGPVQKPGYVWTLQGGKQENETPILLQMNHGKDEQKWFFEGVQV